MNEGTITEAVEKAIAELVAIAAKDAEPIQAQIAKIEADIAKIEEGDFASAALKQALTHIEQAKEETLDQSKAVLGKIIVQVCKKQGVALAPVPVGNGRTSKRLSDKEKARAGQAIMKGNEINNGLSRSDAARLVGITPDQATIVLKQLVTDGLLVKQGTGKNTTYKKK